MAKQWVPRVLYAVGAVTGTGGAALTARGARDQLEAHQREADAERLLEERRAETERRLEATECRLAAFKGLQKKSYTDAVLRMVEFLRRHDKQVSEIERLLVNGIEMPFPLLPRPRALDADVGTWLASASAAVIAGTATAATLSNAADRFGKASTGTPISSLRGAAKDKALKALYGGGSLASGGGGIVNGNRARNVAVGGPAALAAGLVAKAAGTRALTHAQAYETAAATKCADLDLANERLHGIDQRVAELSGVLKGLCSRAVSALDELESVPFDADEHETILQRAMVLVVAVRDVAAAPLLTDEYHLTEESGMLKVKYAPMIAEGRDE